MSGIEEMLNDMSYSAYSAGSGADEEHVVVGRDRHLTFPESLRNIAVQHDHNIETITFDCPRYWDGIDLSTMTVFVAYMRSDGVAGKDLAKRVWADEEDPELMHFEWSIKQHATAVNGPLTLLVCINQVGEDGNELHHWNSELCRDEVYISEGLECGNVIAEAHPDIITQLLLRMDTVEEYIYEQKVKYADTAGHASTADEATHAATASEATHAATADLATKATDADNAINATNAAHATEADHANHANDADTAGSASNAANADKLDGKHLDELYPGKTGWLKQNKGCHYEIELDPVNNDNTYIPVYIPFGKVTDVPCKVYIYRPLSLASASFLDSTHGSQKAGSLIIELEGSEVSWSGSPSYIKTKYCGQNYMVSCLHIGVPGMSLTGVVAWLRAGKSGPTKYYISSENAIDGIEYIKGEVEPTINPNSSIIKVCYKRANITASTATNQDGSSAYPYWVEPKIVDSLTAKTSEEYNLGVFNRTMDASVMRHHGFTEDAKTVNGITFRPNEPDNTIYPEYYKKTVEEGVSLTVHALNDSESGIPVVADDEIVIGCGAVSAMVGNTYYYQEKGVLKSIRIYSEDYAIIGKDNLLNDLLPNGEMSIIIYMTATPVKTETVVMQVERSRYASRATTAELSDRANSVDGSVIAVRAQNTGSENVDTRGYAVPFVHYNPEIATKLLGGTQHVDKVYQDLSVDKVISLRNGFYYMSGNKFGHIPNGEGGYIIDPDNPQKALKSYYTLLKLGNEDADGCVMAFPSTGDNPLLFLRHANRVVNPKGWTLVADLRNTYDKVYANEADNATKVNGVDVSVNETDDGQVVFTKDKKEIPVKNAAEADHATSADYISSENIGIEYDDIGNCVVFKDSNNKNIPVKTAKNLSAYPTTTTDLIATNRGPIYKDGDSLVVDLDGTLCDGDDVEITIQAIRDGYALSSTFKFHGFVSGRDSGKVPEIWLQPVYIHYGVGTQSVVSLNLHVSGRATNTDDLIDKMEFKPISSFNTEGMDDITIYSVSSIKRIRSNY